MVTSSKCLDTALKGRTDFFMQFMRIKISQLFRRQTLLGPGRSRNQCAVLFFAISLLSSCSAMEKASNVIFPKVPPSILFSAIVADEPTAVLAARDVLAKGGTAADAAAILYFALAATYPSQAGLGSGGVCMVYNPRSGSVETLDFSTVAASVTGPDGEVVAIPSAARGMAWLHARYGVMPWGVLLGQAASIAREGVTTSRAFIEDLKISARQLADDGVALSLFFDRLGDPIGEGIILQQIELGAVLGQIGARGVGFAYRGALANRIVEAAASKNQRISRKDLGNSKPKWSRAIGVPLKGHMIYFPSFGGGKVAANMWKALSSGSTMKGADAVAQSRKIAAAAKVAYSGLSGGEAAQSGSGFAVVDGAGVAVTCSVGLSKPFGSGRFLPGLGFTLAPAPDKAVLARQPFSPILVIDQKSKKFILATTGAGGSMAVSSIINVVARILLAGQPLAEASDNPRLHQGGFTDQIIVEKAAIAKLTSALEVGGAKVKSVPSLGRVNAIYCPAGLPPESRGDRPCQVKADKRGHGVGARFKKDRKEKG
jgi:gamma-glutamyltranspeptidase/glutathione hydrolase